ncbi:MAG: BREX system P-loop protein BrxC, partial [Planctomycetota bacterium]|nr:BREX system P-loop protein BrxC [Planctomycetota bacterium]
QQLLINPAIDLGGQPIGKLATIENVYDLVKGNIDSEIRDKIERIPADVDHPLAQAVAKSICLLQFVQSIHRTAENIAATLHPAVDADSLLPPVREALDALERAHKVRKGDNGYRIPTPAEDDWQKQRVGLKPKPADVNRIHGEIIEGLWQPQPAHNFLDTKLFKASLHLNGRPRIDGDIAVQMYLAEPGQDFGQRVAEARARSQVEDKAVFWVVPLDDRIDQATVEVFRSDEMLTRKERGAQTKTELGLVSEEKRKLTNTLRPELRQLLKTACLKGTAYFRGNDRSPGDDATELVGTAGQLLQEVLPRVFDKYHLAAARVQKKDLDALTTSENLHGLTPVFSALNLLKDEKGKPVFELASGPLAEVVARIESHHSYGKAASGKTLADELGNEPFGWSFEAVQLFALCLLRAGKVNVKSKGHTIESALSVEAKNVFSNNNLFRSASFEPKQKVVDFPDLVKAADAFQQTFGKQIAELEQGAVARSIRDELSAREDEVRDQELVLRTHRLPGSEVLAGAVDQMRAIRTGSDEQAVLGFNGSHAEIKEAIKRSQQLAQTLTPPALHTLGTTRSVLDQQWSFLKGEPEVPAGLSERAIELTDLLQRETFFEQLPRIDQHTHAIQSAYTACLDAATGTRRQAYSTALESLRATPGWEQLDDDLAQRIAQPLSDRATNDVPRNTAIPQVRAETDACPKLLHDAIEQVRRAVEGVRMAQVDAGSYFKDGIETEEQLDAALGGLREECAKYVGEGKKVFLK